MAQGYTRQSTANIVNGAVIDALYLNNEFNQIEVAFNAVSGHIHDGSSGQGGVIAFSNISGILTVSAGGTGVSAGAFTTSGQLLISPAASQLSVYTVSTGLKISGTKLEHNMTGSGAIAISGAQITLNVSAPLTISGTQVYLAYTSAFTVSAGKLELANSNTWVTISASVSATAGTNYLVDTSATAVTITLPAAPSAGDTIEYVDAASKFDANNLTFNRNSLPIMGLAENLIVNTRNHRGKLTYADSTKGWRI